MYNILTLHKTARLRCAWIPTGNPRMPLACVWADGNPRSSCREASSSNDESGGMLLCA